MKKLIKRIYQKLKFTVFNDVNYEQSSLCGVSLKTVKETIRKKIDQDDAWFFHLATHNEVIFDIGANVGYTALLALIQNPDRRYILVDPNPLALADASKNLLLNSLGDNASYIPAFVSETEGEKVKFYTIGTGAAGSIYRSYAVSASKLDSWYYVKTTTLDAIYQYYNVIPDLVKIDVEGAEYSVLLGATELASHKKTIFFIEMHSNDEMPMVENAQHILDWCKQVNYKVLYLKEQLEVTNPKMIAHRGKCHLLLVPIGQGFPEYLINIKQSAPLPNSL